MAGYSVIQGKPKRPKILRTRRSEKGDPFLRKYLKTMRKMHEKKLAETVYNRSNKKAKSFANKCGFFALGFSFYLIIDDLFFNSHQRNVNWEAMNFYGIYNCDFYDVNLNIYYDFLSLFDLFCTTALIWGYRRNAFQSFYYFWLLIKFSKFCFCLPGILNELRWGALIRSKDRIFWLLKIGLPLSLIIIGQIVIILPFLVYMFYRLSIPFYRKELIMTNKTIKDYRKQLFLKSRGALFIRRRERMRKWVWEEQAALENYMADICDGRSPPLNYFELSDEEIEKELEIAFARLWDKSNFYLKQQRPAQREMTDREIRKWDKLQKYKANYDKFILKLRKGWWKKLKRYHIDPERFTDPYRDDLYTFAFKNDFNHFLYRNASLLDIVEDDAEKSSKKKSS